MDGKIYHTKVSKCNTNFNFRNIKIDTGSIEIFHFVRFFGIKYVKHVYESLFLFYYEFNLILLVSCVGIITFI